MTKNEQIEEIATVISNHSDKYNWNLFEFECENLAIVLHNLGYRKIDDVCFCNQPIPEGETECPYYEEIDNEND